MWIKQTYKLVLGWPVQDYKRGFPCTEVPPAKCTMVGLWTLQCKCSSISITKYNCVRFWNNHQWFEEQFQYTAHKLKSENLSKHKHIWYSEQNFQRSCLTLVSTLRLLESRIALSGSNKDLLNTNWDWTPFGRNNKI